MESRQRFYIDGGWMAPNGAEKIISVNPATEVPNGEIPLGNASDVDVAVAAARNALPRWSRTSIEDRLQLLKRIAAVYESRRDDLAQAIHCEMGAPLWLAAGAQTAMGSAHLKATMGTLQQEMAERAGAQTQIRFEPIGVCGLITPWNWPINQIACKVFPAIAAGCTVVLKPSEVAPYSAEIFAAILHDSGVPPGVFNLVHGRGDIVGTELARHPDIRMMSFTGSNRAGVAVARNAAATVKRVSQELGGKSPYILCEDSPFATSVAAAVRRCFSNSGQTCTAPTRLLVPRSRLQEVETLAKACADSVEVGTGNPGSLGPLANAAQFDRVQSYISGALHDDLGLLCGGLGKPEDRPVGYYVRPTIFTDVDNTATIAREEVFGPVLCIIPYADEDEALRIANDTDYGLAAYVSSSSMETARRVAMQLEAGMVYINEAAGDVHAPFGGYKQSGNGREWGLWGLREFLETKAVIGWHADA